MWLPTHHHCSGRYQSMPFLGESATCSNPSSDALGTHTDHRNADESHFPGKAVACILKERNKHMCEHNIIDSIQVEKKVRILRCHNWHTFFLHVSGIHTSEPSRCCRKLWYNPLHHQQNRQASSSSDQRLAKYGHWHQVSWRQCR